MALVRSALFGMEAAEDKVAEIVDIVKSQEINRDASMASGRLKDAKCGANITNATRIKMAGAEAVKKRLSQINCNPPAI